jgi:hypothetical protein
MSTREKHIFGQTVAEARDEQDPSPKSVSREAQIRAAQSEIRALKKQIGTDESVVGQLRDEFRALPTYKRRPVRRGRQKHAPHAAVMILADAHADEYVASDEVEGLAEHSLATHEEKMHRLADKVIEITDIVRATAPVTDLHIWDLGDNFLGEIHPEETAYGQELPLPVTLPRVARIKADTIMRMAAGFERTRFVGKCGNHGRLTKKTSYKMNADRNWDMACYLIAQEYCRNDDRIEFNLPKSIMHVEHVMGWRNLLTHGDCATRTHRTPYFGIESYFFQQRNARRGTDQDFDYVWMGHWHHEFRLRGFIRGNPCMVGANQFSLYRMAEATQSSQRIEFFTEKHGPTCGWTIGL